MERTEKPFYLYPIYPNKKTFLINPELIKVEIYNLFKSADVSAAQKLTSKY